MQNITELTFAAALLAMSHGNGPAASTHGHTLARSTQSHAVAHVRPTRMPRTPAKRTARAAQRTVMEAAVTPAAPPDDPSLR